MEEMEGRCGWRKVDTSGSRFPLRTSCTISSSSKLFLSKGMSPNFTTAASVPCSASKSSLYPLLRRPANVEEG